MTQIKFELIASGPDLNADPAVGFQAGGQRAVKGYRYERIALKYRSQHHLPGPARHFQGKINEHPGRDVILDQPEAFNF